MPINGVKWRFLGLNEKRCKRTYYIYIFIENPPAVKKCFLRQTHREGNPPLDPPGRCAPPLGQRKTKNHFPEYEMLFLLITGF